MKRIVLLIAMIAGLCSCEHQEINTNTDTDTDTKVVFDWSKLNEGDTKSPTMDVHFYNEQTGEHLVIQGNQDGAEKFIPYGTYKVLSFSSGVENVDYKGLDSYVTAEAHAITMQAKSASGNLLLQPGNVYASHKDLTLSPSDKSIHSLLLEPYIKKMALNIDLSGEIDRVANCVIAISGIATGVNLSTGKVLYSPKTTYSIVSDQIPTLPLETELSFFGCDDNANVMTIDITLTDGTVTTVTADITEALDKINEPDFPGIEIKPEVKIEPDPTTGFKATLIGWKVGTGSGAVGGK